MCCGSQKSVEDRVTVLIYTFPKPGTEDAAFAKIVASIQKTWKHVGQLKTVIVASHRFAAVEKFVAEKDNVELQVEPTLVPGNIKTMSMDCIKRLYRRFSTPYVLVIQDDGFPIRGGLAEFLGKCDFYGAPIISDGWKRKLAYAIGLGSFNGGFSLRSRRFCEYASKMWFSFFSKFMAEDNRHLGEDFYYTTLLKFLPMTWLKFSFPSEQEAFRFAVDTLGGLVAYPKGTVPFGLHGKDTLAVAGCRLSDDLISFSHAAEANTLSDDQRRACGGVYPFAALREQTVSDFSRIRVLAKELSAELMRAVQHGTGASVRETSLALVAAAKRTGFYIPYSECENFGDQKRRRSGESEVYAGADYKTLVKVKDPTAKAAIKRTSPDDWLYEHIVHNVLFPETRYEFVGVTESVGSVRIILRQKIVDTVSYPSEDEIAAELGKKGLLPDERYFYGNELLAVTDVGERSDNVLLGSDGTVCFIDPLIRLKKPAAEVIEALVGPLDGLKE